MLADHLKHHAEKAHSKKAWWAGFDLAVRLASGDAFLDEVEVPLLEFSEFLPVTTMEHGGLNLMLVEKDLKKTPVRIVEGELGMNRGPEAGGCRGAGFRGGFELGDDGVHLREEDAAVEVGLVLEIKVERPDGKTGAAGDAGQRGVVVAGFAKRVLGGGKDELAAIVFFPGP